MSLPDRTGSVPATKVDDPLAIVTVRYFERVRAGVIELVYAYGGSERLDGTAGYAAELASRAGLRMFPTSDGTRLWVKVPDHSGAA